MVSRKCHAGSNPSPITRRLMKAPRRDTLLKSQCENLSGVSSRGAEGDEGSLRRFDYTSRHELPGSVAALRMT